MSVEIVLDPVEAAAVVVQTPAASPVQVASPGVSPGVVSPGVVSPVQVASPGGVPPVQVASAGGGGVTDHGALTGLGDDDHTQYALADGSRGAFAASTHQHTMADLTDYTPPDPGGLKVYTSWAEVDAETEPTMGVLTTDDWAPAGLTYGGTPRDATFFITTQVQTIAAGEPGAGVWRRQELRTWVDAFEMPIWRVRQTFDPGGPWEEWFDGTYWDLPNALSMSLAKAEDAVFDLNETYFNNPKAPYVVGHYNTNWRTLTGFAELPNTAVVAHVFHGGTPAVYSSGNWTQTVVVALEDGTSRTITRVSTDGTSYGAWTLQPTIPNVTISDDYVLTIGA